jgi:hypothetical protein
MMLGEVQTDCVVTHTLWNSRIEGDPAVDLVGFRRPVFGGLLRQR